MSDLVCKGCGGVVDTTGIEPFTLCECSDCGAEIIIPLKMDYLLLERQLGEKNLFKIYEGFDQGQNVNSIIFIMDKNTPEFKQFMPVAKEEAVSLSTLKHPNISPVLNFGEIDGNFFVTEPKMDGYPLSDYSPETQGLLDVEKVVDVIQAAGLGLAVAHHKEFIHHDVCLDNLHIDARGNVRVKNFFISRFTYQYFQNKEEISSSVLPYFISPEKAESRVEDKRGDVFSFGVVLYFMLTGKFPFSGRTEIETVYSRIKRKNAKKKDVFTTEKSNVLTPETIDYITPVAPNNFRNDIPEEISSMVMDMLSYHPVQRPKFTEILTAINLTKAKKEKEEIVGSAQKEMVRETVSTKTRAIPMMKNLAGECTGKKEKKRFFKL